MQNFSFEVFWGVSESCCVVWHLLDSGKNLQQVQFDTICKILTFQSNYTHAGIDGTGLVFKPNFSMMDLYLDAHVMAPTLIRFSKELPS